MDANEAAAVVSKVVRRLTVELGIPVFTGVAAGIFMDFDSLQMVGLLMSCLMGMQWISSLVWPDDYNILEWPLISLPVSGLWLISFWFGFVARLDWASLMHRSAEDPVPTRFPVLANAIVVLIPALPFIYQTVVSLAVASRSNREAL